MISFPRQPVIYKAFHKLRKFPRGNVPTCLVFNIYDIIFVTGVVHPEIDAAAKISSIKLYLTVTFIMPVFKHKCVFLVTRTCRMNK